jgi:hypothetical protein
MSNHKGHLHFTLLAVAILAKPANGYTYGPADANACAPTWAHSEICAEMAVWSHGDTDKKRAVAAFRVIIDGRALDQVDGLQNLETLNSSQLQALTHGTLNTRFINVSSHGAEQSMEAMNAGGTPIKGAGAWQGPNAHGAANVNLDNLLQAYADMFQLLLNAGGY